MVLSKTQEGIIFKIDDMLAKRHMSIYKICMLANIRYETINIYIKGEVTRIDICILYKLCTTLNCTIDNLIEIKKITK